MLNGIDPGELLKGLQKIAVTKLKKSYFVPHVSQQEHDAQVSVACQAMRENWQAKHIIVSDRTDELTHCTRTQDYKKDRKKIPLRNLNRVVSIDLAGTKRPGAERIVKSITVEGSCNMETIAKYCLSRGVRPLVVPEFKGITAGGAVAGGGLESTSHRCGLFENSVLWFDLITGDGTLVRCSPIKNSDLFYGCFWSMGSLGYVTQVCLEVVDATPYIALTYEWVNNREEAIQLLAAKSRSKNPPEFLEGIAYSRDSHVIISGESIARPTGPEFHLGPHWSQWFYWHVREKRPRTECMPTLDYLFRHDRGAFWLAESKMNPTLLNRAALGWLFTMENHHILGRAKKTKDNERQRFLADLGVPFEKLAELMDCVDETLGIYPVWWLPFKIIPNKDKIFSPDGVCTQTDFILDVGIYGRPKVSSFDALKVNRDFEAFVHRADVGGMKGFETVCYYSKTEFWQYFREDKYNELRKRYCAEVFPTIYEKIRFSEGQP